MKKFLVMLLAVTLIISVFTMDASAVFRMKSAKASYGTAVIDGVMDDIYKNSDPMKIEFMSSIANSGTEEDVPRAVKAVAYLTWDENALYLFIEAKDPTPPKTALIGPSTDGVEIFADFDNINSIEASPDGRAGNYGENGIFFKTAAYAEKLGTPEYLQFWVENFSTYNDSLMTAAADVTAVKTVITSDGYIIERKIPFSAATKAMVKEGYKFGFQIALLDDLDDDCTRDMKVTWGEATDELSPASWGQSAHCDEVVLAAAPPPPATEPPAAPAEDAPAAEAPAAAPAKANPTTADPITLIIAMGALSAMGALTLKKKR